MPFINEIIPAESKSKIESIRSPLTSQPIELMQWTADHARNAFLLWAGQEREPPHIAHFVFLVRGAQFHVGLGITYAPANGKYNYSYSLKFITPIRDGSVSSEITALLKDALTVRSGRSTPLHDVTFDF